MKMSGDLTICACRWRNLTPLEQVEKLAEKARNEGHEVVIIDDLCEFMERGDETELASLTGTAIAACHQRAVKSLLEWRGVEAGEIICLREGAGDTGPGNDAWFPVIDKARCTECGQCLDFCPFGVYEMVNERVKVMHPTNCKNNCPACARNCPSEAIIFPKYGKSPINGGIEQEEQAIRVDHSTLYTDAFRTRLAERRIIGTPLYKKEK